MSESSDRLEKEFAEITRSFTDHPQISIVSTEGSPATQYVIEYRMNGLVQLDDGEIVQSDQHRIELSLSFGFPHFPPNCRPLTKIFHPDMDPSAIKIAEFWAESSSLAELISQIGKMICWQVYSSEDGFNQAALDWLVTNKDAVPMDTLQVSAGATLPDVDLDLGLEDESDATSGGLDLGLSATKEDASSFVADIDFNFSGPGKSGGGGGKSKQTNSPSSDNGGIEFSLDDSTPPDLDLGLESQGASGSSFVEEIDFNFEVSPLAEEVELSLGDSTSAGDSPLELSLENESIKPVDKESFSFVTAGDDVQNDGAIGDIVVEDVAGDEPDLTPSFIEADAVDEDIDLDLSVVDVDYDILKGMIDQRNYVAANTKLTNMSPENISKASAVLLPMVDQRIKQADGVHSQARKLETEGLLEDAAKKLEAVMNLVQDYPNIEADMKRVRDAWAGISSPATHEVALGLERPEAVEVAPAQVRDTMLTSTVVAGKNTGLGSGEPGGAKVKKKAAVKKDEGSSFVKLRQNKPLMFAALGLVLALCLSGWTFYEWRSYSLADQKWGEINNLLEKKEYQKARDECLAIRELLGGVKIIMGGGKKELLARVDDLLQSEHLLEGLEGKVLWQGQYISKRAFRAYDEIKDLVEEAERRGALSRWQESADLYAKAFKIAQDNQKRLNEKFYADLELDVKNAKFANLVSLGKTYFIGAKWSKAIESFEAALTLASEDGVADPSISYDVNRYLQRAWFSQYVIDGDEALKAADFSTASEKFTKAYAIAKDPNLIDEQNREQVLVKLKQSSLIKIMDDAERYVADKLWQDAVKSYRQAKQYTMDGYPLVDMDVAQSQNRVEGLLVSAIVGLEREVIARKRSARQYAEVEEAYGRIIATIDSSPLRDEPVFQKIKRRAMAEKGDVHLRAIVDAKVAYLEKNYRKIVVDNFTGVTPKALSNVNVEFLGEENRALQFKIQCREQRESKFYTLELIYQYDIDLDQWGFPEM